MFAGVGLQQFPEVGTAGGEHDLVRGERPLIAGERHVHKVLLLAQMPEGAEDRGLEVVPLERVLLLGRRRRHGRLHFVAVVGVAQVGRDGGRRGLQEASVGGAVVLVMLLVLLLSRGRRMQES